MPKSVPGEVDMCGGGSQGYGQSNIGNFGAAGAGACGGGCGGIWGSALPQGP
jgi:hypothetical protein